MAHSLKGVLFDLDGTLLDTYGIILCSMRHTLKTYFPERDYTEAELMAGVGTPLLAQMMGFAGGDETLGEEMTAFYRAHNNTVHDERVRAFPGTLAALEALRAQGLRLGVVTSKREGMAARGMRIAGIAEQFDFIIGSDSWHEHKPAPGPILHGCDLLGVAPGECLYVGDSRYDMQAGNAAGCATVAALWGMFPEQLPAEHPAYSLATISELPALTARLH